MNDGFIVLHRKMIDWGWYDCLTTKSLFIHCLLMANHKPNIWRGKVIKRGEFITSFAHLAEQSGLSIRQVRTSLKNLESTQEVTRTSTHRYTLISIANYSNYQDRATQEATQEATNQRQTNDKQTTTNNNDNNENKKKYIYTQFLKFCPFTPFTAASDLPQELQDEIQRIMKQPFLTLKLSESQQLDFIDYWFTADDEGYLLCMDKTKNFNPSRKASNWKKYNQDDNLSTAERMKKLLEDE